MQHYTYLTLRNRNGLILDYVPICDLFSMVFMDNQTLENNVLIRLMLNNFVEIWIKCPYIGKEHIAICTVGMLQRIILIDDFGNQVSRFN